MRHHGCVPNELALGTSRLGWMVDGNPDTPHVSVMLENADDEIRLTIPTGGMGDRGQYSRWFGFNTQYGDDPQRTKFAYRPPDVLQVQDPHGSVILVGCRASRTVSTLGAGQGQVVADFAVMGGDHLRYSTLHGMRTVIPALAAWTEMKSIEIAMESDGANRVQEVRLSMRAQPETPVSRALNLRLRPSWLLNESESEGTFTATNLVSVVTSAQRARPWEEHLEPHQAIRELVALSAWRRFGFSGVQVNRSDDPHRVLSGRAIEERWASVVTHRLRWHQPWQGTPRFLWLYSDFGPGGIRRWLRIRRHFERAIQPLVGVLNQEGGFLETQMVQTGIALESLAFQLELDGDRSGLNNRGQLSSYARGLERILQDMDFEPLADTPGWIQRSTSCHRALKHPDKPMPDSVDLANTYRENLIVLRSWVALRLGVSAPQLAKRLTMDPLSRSYTRR